jgi:hypothetical protein
MLPETNDVFGPRLENGHYSTIDFEALASAELTSLIGPRLENGNFYSRGFRLPHKNDLEAKLNRNLTGNVAIREEIIGQLEDLSRRDLMPEQFIAYVALRVSAFAESNGYVPLPVAYKTVPTIIHSLVPARYKSECLDLLRVVKAEHGIKVTPPPKSERREPKTKAERRQQWIEEGVIDPDRPRPSEKSKPKRLKPRDQKRKLRFLSQQASEQAKKLDDTN